MLMRELWLDSWRSIKSRCQLRRSKFNPTNGKCSKCRSSNSSKQVLETLVLASTRIHIWYRDQHKPWISRLRCRNKLKRPSLKELAQREQIPQSVQLVPAEDTETILEVALDRRPRPRLLGRHLHKLQIRNKWIKEFLTTNHKEIKNPAQASNPR